ncbi:hypothetical protein GQ44DRAFT_733599 [Phaeosphaeriaceae sp. PMI808]|nr:hypothetical protein GQ44DRAFT_733599 [Phaeosphaeriaceae sp. PMI808]
MSYTHDMYDYSRRNSYTTQRKHTRRRSESPSSEYISRPTYSSSDYIQRPEPSTRSSLKRDHPFPSALSSKQPTDSSYRSRSKRTTSKDTMNDISYRLHYYKCPSYNRSSGSDYISHPEESTHDYISPSPTSSRSPHGSPTSRSGFRVRFSQHPSYAETDSNDSIAEDAQRQYRYLDDDEYDSSDVESVASDAFPRRAGIRAEYAESDIESLRSGSVSGRDSGRRSSIVSRSSCSESDSDDEDCESVGSAGSIGSRDGSDYTSVRGGEDGVGSDVCGAGSVSGDDGGVYMDGYKYFSGSSDDDDEY